MSSSCPDYLTILEESRVSPPPATVGNRFLPLTYFDFFWIRQPPIHYLFFYQVPSITQTQFLETIIPYLKRSLSITLQHFFPFAGNLIVFPTKNPEIGYVEGRDSVAVTFAEISNNELLDFDELTANHPRSCEKFYHLTPPLGEPDKTNPDFTKIPLFSLQVTLFPKAGISIGMTNHHSLGDASTRFYFMKAWTSIARSGCTDHTFLAQGTLPVYDRSLVKNPKLEESYLKFAKVKTLKEDYEAQKLSGPTDKLRATFILPRGVLNRLKNVVTTEVPSLAYVSSFTVACGYIWSCLAGTHEDDELQLFGFPIDCRARTNPPLPAAYYGNCIGGCVAMEKVKQLSGKQGFVTAAKVLGESLHKTLTDKDGIMKDIEAFEDLFPGGDMPKSIIGVAGTPKLKFYEMDFGWGNPKKIETVSIDYGSSISMNACREKNEDLEIGVSLSPTKMETFIRLFEDGLRAYV